MIRQVDSIDWLGGICMCMYVCIYVCIYIYVYISSLILNLHIYIYVYIYMCVCVGVCTRLWDLLLWLFFGCKTKWNTPLFWFFGGHLTSSRLILGQYMGSNTKKRNVTPNSLIKKSGPCNLNTLWNWWAGVWIYSLSVPCSWFIVSRKKILNL